MSKNFVTAVRYNEITGYSVSGDYLSSRFPTKSQMSLYNVYNSHIYGDTDFIVEDDIIFQATGNLQGTLNVQGSQALSSSQYVRIFQYNGNEIFNVNSGNSFSKSNVSILGRGGQLINVYNNSNYRLDFKVRNISMMGHIGLGSLDNCTLGVNSTFTLLPNSQNMLHCKNVSAGWYLDLIITNAVVAASLEPSLSLNINELL